MELNAIKRKMECCYVNEEKRLKTDQFQCQYCECTFRNAAKRDDHVRSIHTCSTCRDVVLTDDDWAIHDDQHDKEEQLEGLEEQRQHKLNDDFVLSFVKANNRKEYRSQSKFEPDFDYIINTYRFEREELVRILKEFKREFLDALCGVDEVELQYDVDDLIYLVENDALSIEDMADFLDNMLFGPANSNFVSQLLAHLLDIDYPIKPVWVAKAIHNNELIERIKAKHTFTFDEIFEARDWNPYSSDDERDGFYFQHRHFPDSDFEEE